MKKKIVRASVLVLAATMSLSSCVVSKKKYDDLMARKNALEVDKASLEEQKSTLEEEKASLENQKAQLEQERADLEKQKAEYQASLQQALKEGKTLGENLNLSKSQIDKLSADLKAREQKLAELQRILDEKEKAVKNLRARVSNALLGFNDKDLTVQVRNGKVYVSLAEQLLFNSGSTKVDPKGVDALKKLAQVLKEQQDVNVVVEGHTDDVPIARGTVGMQDNWDLSVLRATEITRILTQSGVAPERVTPSGRSLYVPLENTKTKEARQKNRRTEIILTPKLDELFQILESA
ncbi:OmpA family protein [Pontibacter sp. BT310]|jgi:chemotaxis protein MotB|uniref:OmpA family protein n=1 Tax=Pontibacter populi TaxID=890055 RepID=A0ABS6XGB3_9BACT|nr:MULTISPECIES: OmpA family protein [Pontibacter]MBJ6119720.1 OmpA family protein [Pontibacter sp. BT310]MBR0572149.1 OmpA family protein [Microvirga sp. STS03]MBW3366573.1 OmpA family protein [Pontibacter populi]